MSRDVHDAHYQHQRRGLSPLVRPPVQHATHMVWTTRGDLLVATADGRVDSVHPAMGTRTLLKGLGAPCGVGVSGDRLVVAERGGRWAAYESDGKVIVEGTHPFEGNVAVQFRENKVLLTGMWRGEKQLLFYDSGRKVLRIQLPPKAVGFVLDDHLGLAQSTPVGLETIYLRSGGRFHGTEFTPHQLTAAGDFIVGHHSGGMRVWAIRAGKFVDVHLPGTTAVAISDDGIMGALGTTEGSVGLVDLREPESREDLYVVEVTDEPIRSIAFSSKGKYLATAADGVIIWTWT